MAYFYDLYLICKQSSLYPSGRQPLPKEGVEEQFCFRGLSLAGTCTMTDTQHWIVVVSVALQAPRIRTTAVSMFLSLQGLLVSCTQTFPSNPRTGWVTPGCLCRGEQLHAATLASVSGGQLHRSFPFSILRQPHASPGWPWTSSPSA